MVSLMDSGPESIFCGVTNRVAWHIHGQVSWCSGRVSVMSTGRGRPLGHMSDEPSTLLRSDESLSHGLWTCSLWVFSWFAQRAWYSQTLSSMQITNCPRIFHWKTSVSTDLQYQLRHTLNFSTRLICFHCLYSATLVCLSLLLLTPQLLKCCPFRIHLRNC